MTVRTLRRAAWCRTGWLGLLFVTTTLTAIPDASALAQAPEGGIQTPPAPDQRDFDISPQSLTTALTLFGQQAHLQITADGGMLHNLSTHGLRGRMTVEQGLSRLLSGTGLAYSANGSGTITLRRAETSRMGSSADADGFALPTVRVEGAAGSYSPYSGSDRVSDPEEIAANSKTGTKLADLPGSVQIIPRRLLTEQGATMLRQSLYNASGVNVGGQDTKGYYDHFLIRGLNAQIYQDSFSDGDLLGGISHSLNGVERVEVLEGPGSALFGSGPPGGTINIIHYTPSSDLHYGASLQGGSFGTITNNDYITGPTGISGLNYRIDATFSHTDGFRNLSSHDYEIRPSLSWKIADHTINLAVDMRQIDETPDSYGIIYFNGSPLKNVPTNAKYSSPFAFAHGDFIRPTLTDTWNVTDYLTINNRFSYLHRTLDSLANGDSSSTQVVDGEVVKRQLRRENDDIDSFDYQLEPVWKFRTAGIRHTLLTGFEFLHQTIDTNRVTADLPNIPNAFAPVPPETSTAGLTFLCDAKHSCDNDHLAANRYSLYATDQVDVTTKLKVRVGVRQDWYNTSLTPLISVPGRFAANGQPLLAGVTDSRNDTPVSWNVGMLYKLTSWVSPYFGISKSYLANFNSENTQSGIGAPESAMQYEVGAKFSFLNQRIVLNTALFTVSRDNVAALQTVNNIESVVFDAQRTRGVEASLDTQLTSQWHLLGNVTAQEAVITSNPQGISAIGKHPQGAPAYVANLWTTYDFSIGKVRGFRVGGGLNYQSKSYSDLTNVNSIPAYVIVNAVLGYEASNWGINLNLRNITNQRYFIAANAAGAYMGEPLSALVSLHSNF